MKFRFELTEEQIELALVVEDCIKKFMFLCNTGSNVKVIEPKMSSSSLDLYNSLIKSGIKPEFSSHLIAIRGTPPDTLDFYKHPHSCEDLLTYLQVPEDITLNKKFTLKLFSMKRDQSSAYIFEMIKGGWKVKTPLYMTAVTCFIGDYRELFLIFKQDGVIVASNFDSLLDKYWAFAKFLPLEEEQVQQIFDDLSAWSEKICKSMPKVEDLLS